jgi:4-amino-4-deoxy-L-arabinose transferase-like glycosyltransferase
LKESSGSARDLFVILAVGCLVLLPNLGVVSLWDLDEALWGSTTVEMARRGDWIVPWHNDEVSTHKPPFMFWVMLVGSGLCAENEFGFRIGSAVFGILTALVVYRLGTQVACRQVGLVAAIACLTAVNLVLISRAANPDIELTFLGVAALAIFVHSCRTDAGNNGAGVTAGRSFSSWPPQGRIGPLSLAAAVALYAVLGLAVLTKGPLGVALPAVALSLFVWWHNLVMSREARAGRALGSRLAAVIAEGWRAAWALRPLTALVVVLIVAGPWYVLVHERSGGAFGTDFIGIHHVQRFLEPMEGHRGPLFFYLPALLVGLFPWSMFAIPTALDTAQRLRGEAPGRATAMLLLAWLATWIGIFSLAQTKLPNYILPAYPAAALLVALFLIEWMRSPTPASRRWMQIALWLLIGIGGATAIGCLLAPTLRFGGRTILEMATAAESAAGILRLAAWSGGIMAVGAATCLWLVARDRRSATLVAYGGTAVALALFLFGFVAIAAGRLQPAYELVRIMREHGATETTPLGQCRYSQPSLVLYGGRRVASCRDAEGCRKFFTDHPDGMLVVRIAEQEKGKDLLPAGTDDIRSEIPGSVVLGTVADFPKRSRLLVVRRADSAR